MQPKVKPLIFMATESHITCELYWLYLFPTELYDSTRSIKNVIYTCPRISNISMARVM